MKFHKFFFFLFFFFYQQAFAQQNFYDKQIKPGLKKSVDSTSLYLIAGGSTGFFLTHQEDNTIHDHWKDHHVLSESTTQWGNDYGRYAIGAVIALTQTYFDKENGINHIRALVANTVLTTTLKYSVQRERPNQSNHLSFPSGHTSDAFTTATSLSYAYGWKAAVIAYPLATFVGITRIGDDAHWLSDVTAGAFIGIIMGRAFFYSAEDQQSPQSFHWQFLPIVDQDFKGLQLVADF